MNNDSAKFRVWCGKEFKYSGGHFLVDQDGVLFCRNKKNPDILIKLANHGCFEPCTGLRDKNRNLVYRNDIILYNNQKYVVKCFDGCFVLAPLNSPYDMCGYRPFTELSRVPKLLETQWEIIGNIHTQKDGE